jgi:hypothetical protein
MNIKIEYESDVFLPKEIDDNLEEIEERVLRDHLEHDKIMCHFSTLRQNLIRWFIDNNKKEQKG